MITDEDVELFDILGRCFYNYALINDLTNKLIHEAKIKVVGNASQFYQDWCNWRLRGEKELPFNYGTILMFAWAVIVNSNERWLDFLPDTPVEESDPKWGLRESNLKYTSKENPSISDVIIKLRHSISHADFKVNVHDINVPYKKLLNETTYIFGDSVKNDFELEISMKNLSELLSETYKTMFERIKEYMDNKGKSEKR